MTDDEIKQALLDAIEADAIGRIDGGESDHASRLLRVMSDAEGDESLVTALESHIWSLEKQVESLKAWLAAAHEKGVE